jgi:hypothetical protein
MAAFLAKRTLDGGAVQPMMGYVARPKPRKKPGEESTHGSSQTFLHITSMVWKPGTRREQRGC